MCEIETSNPESACRQLVHRFCKFLGEVSSPHLIKKKNLEWKNACPLIIPTPPPAPSPAKSRRIGSARPSLVHLLPPTTLFRGLTSLTHLSPIYIHEGTLSYTVASDWRELQGDDTRSLSPRDYSHNGRWLDSTPKGPCRAAEGSSFCWRRALCKARNMLRQWLNPHPAATAVG